MTRKSARKILFVSSEVAPFSKTGGLADISAALPRALANLGDEVRVLTPCYGSIDREQHMLSPVKGGAEHALRMHNHDFLVSYLGNEPRPGDVRTYFLECDSLFGRPGIYVDPFSNQDYIDNDYRYIALSKAALELCRILDWTPDIFHCHDWQSGLLAFYLKLAQSEHGFARSRSVMTVHNMSYQGLFSSETLPRIGNGEPYFYPGGPLEFYNHVNFLKAGIVFADGVNTVSPTYAKEIQSAYEYGFGLETVLRSRGDLGGILNGIDVEIWNPATDTHIAATYSNESLDLKAQNKRALSKRLELPYSSSVPLLGMISRIVGQKGFDLLVSGLPNIIQMPAQFVLLGSGDPHYEHILRELARVFPDRAAVQIGYDEDLAHLIEAGADIFVMPSKYEPCGLNQMMSMRYGTVPVVRATGGLADTVVDADQDPQQGTGFCFTDYSAAELTEAARRAIRAYQDKSKWRAIQRRGMLHDFSWKRSAQMYQALYERCLAQPPGIVA